MQMMPCPHCGVSNSVKRERCYQCEQPLHPAPTEEKPAQPEGPPALTTCADCCYANSAPPLGRRMGHDQVWCSRQEQAVPAAQAASDCYEPAFTWSRNQIID